MVTIKKILIVDDEAGIRNLLFEVLSQKGFRVTLAKDGKDSLNLMKRRRFDLLITDIEMPRLNGLELLKRMKTAGRREKVIVMTGKTLDRKDLEGDLPPVCSLLHKPFPLDDFLDVVTSVLTRPERRLRRRRSILPEERKRALGAV